MKESVCTHEAQLISLANALQDGMWHEVQLFSTLSLARLTKSPGLRWAHYSTCPLVSGGPTTVHEQWGLGVLQWSVCCDNIGCILH